MWDLMAGDRIRYVLALGFLLVAAGLLYLIPLVPQAVIDVVLGSEADKASDLSRAIIAVLGGRERVAADLWLPLTLIAAIAIAVTISIS